MRYAIILLALLLAACDGGGEEAQPTPTPSPTIAQPSPTPEATATAEPTPSVEFGPLSQQTPVEGTFLIDLAKGRWLRLLSSYLDQFLALSPAGDTFVYLQQMPAAGLAAARVDGSGARQIADGRFTGAAFSPDGKVLAIWRTEGTLPLILIPWPDGQPVDIDLPVPITAAAWSADGITLAVNTPDGIYFVSREGNALKGSTPWAEFAWAPHETRLAFWTSNPSVSSVFTLAPGEEPRLLVGLPGDQVSGASWSADGSLLAVGVGRLIDVNFSVSDVRVIEPATGQTRFTITGVGRMAMAWSPVEPLLLFDGNGCSSDWQLMLVKGDGSDLRPLAAAHNGVPLGHAWSPDGREVATAWVERNAVTAVDVESGATRTLVRGPGLIYRVQWVTASRLVVTTIGGTGFCEDMAGQTTEVVFP